MSPLVSSSIWRDAVHVQLYMAVHFNPYADTPMASYFDQAECCAQAAACHLLLRRHNATDYWLTQFPLTSSPKPSVRRAGKSGDQ